ncbi:MAG TPA: glycoside hydrolase family 30 beta sandwich domain-containing protein, partial [Candidatus Paceibacterota bacterium]|nr:glycoside hydrolase family 30 beta sandwich domain-containing protein [Candidatus Paceibacterota bacterium]
PPPTSTGTVTVNANTKFQTISGWEATSQSGQDSPEFSQYANTLFDRAANDLGINRIRLEVRSGMENDTDYWSLFDNGNGSLSSAEWRCVRYSTKNDNSSHTSINPSGFKFSELDDKVNKIVKPLQQKLQARGERLHINLNYVAFTKQITGSGCSSSLQYHHDDPDEYAEFILAASLHLRGMGITPDTWEIILEPDNVPEWDGRLIGQAILATAQKLEANGFSNPKFIAPSNTNMGSAISYFDAMANVLGSSNVTKYVKEFSYHRYGGVSDTNLQTIASRASQYGIGTSMLEHIGSGYEDLHKDLKLANNSAWQQFTLAFPASDNGGHYYTIGGSPGNPTVNIGSRTKFLRQYFKFIREGAVRIKADSTNNNFDPVAFINKNGKYVVVVKANSGGAFTVGGLPAGPYGITYTTGSQYNQSMPDVTISNSQAVNANIPSGGVITIYRR